MSEAAESKSPLLRGRGVTATFGGLSAVDHLDFVVNHGELLGIIGPNGAGKTTLVNLITGVLRPTAGDILFEDRSIVHLKAHQVAQLGIARTFQVTKPFPNLSVRQNVAIGALFATKSANVGMREALAHADAVLERVGLAAKADYRGDQLTVADRKGLELARALVRRPKLLLLDEVMAGLNLHEIEAVMELIRHINTEGVTIVVVEHVMKAIMGLCSRVLAIHHGQKLAEGTAAEVATDPNVIREYLGARYGHSK